MELQAITNMCCHVKVLQDPASPEGSFISGLTLLLGCAERDAVRLHAQRLAAGREGVRMLFLAGRRCFGTVACFSAKRCLHLGVWVQS